MDKSKSDRQKIAVNKKAHHEYTIEETFEAGIILQGWEVKSLRAGRAQITESYVLFKNGEAWLVGSLITPLPTASTHIQPEPDRTRKLLMHKNEVSKLTGYVQRKGYTIVALSLYWKKQHVKVTLGIAKGKKSHDKRASIKERDWQRQKQREFRRI